MFEKLIMTLFLCTIPILIYGVIEVIFSKKDMCIRWWIAAIWAMSFFIIGLYKIWGGK